MSGTPESDGSPSPAQNGGKIMTTVKEISHRPTPQEIRRASDKKVPDILARGLAVLFCGINPGLYSAAVGHHFARPGNRFWRALYDSGFTRRLLAPGEGASLLTHGLGITNLVARATASAADLTKTDLIDGRRLLERKVIRYAPRWIAILGIGAYRTAFGRPRAVFGLQTERMGKAGIWVLPNPSGLNASYQPAELSRAFRALREAAGNARKV